MVGDDGLAHVGIVACVRPLHRFSVLPPQPGGAGDMGEQKGDRAVGQGTGRSHTGHSLCRMPYASSTRAGTCDAEHNVAVSPRTAAAAGLPDTGGRIAAGAGIRLNQEEHHDERAH